MSRLQAANARKAQLQAETDEQMLADAAHIRQRMGAAEAGSSAMQWTELHDALTSMRSHNKSIPEALRSDDLDMVNKWVCTPASSSLCCVPVLRAQAAGRFA